MLWPISTVNKRGCARDIRTQNFMWISVLNLDFYPRREVRGKNAKYNKREMLENGLRKAFPSMNEPPWIAVLSRFTVVESEYDIGDLLVFAAEVRRFDGKEDLWRRKISSCYRPLSYRVSWVVSFVPNKPSFGQLGLRQRLTNFWPCR